MAWRIEWSKEALRDMGRMEQGDARRLMKKLESSPESPQSHFERLSGHDDYKLRAGDLRAICLLTFQSQVIFVEKVGHRKNIYKKFSKR